MVIINSKYVCMSSTIVYKENIFLSPTKLELTTSVSQIDILKPML